MSVHSVAVSPNQEVNAPDMLIHRSPFHCVSQPWPIRCPPPPLRLSRSCGSTRSPHGAFERA